MQIYNGKFGGGKIMLNPLGLINDGFMELTFVRGNIGAAWALYQFVRPGGRMAYESCFVNYRCRSVKIINRQKVDGMAVQQDINIDGEDLTFNNFAKYRVLPSSLDLIVDCYLLSTKYFLYG